MGYLGKFYEKWGFFLPDLGNFDNCGGNTALMLRAVSHPVAIGRGKGRGSEAVLRKNLTSDAWW